MRSEVVLVDTNDQVTGRATKRDAHNKGLLHRAFSVFITSSEGEVLIQQRAWDKYHSPGLWSNTCCSHPQPGEDIFDSARQRLFEEMRIDSQLTFAGKFYYKIEFEEGLAEHEIDYVFTGHYDGRVNPNPEEVADFKWISREDLFRQIEAGPERFTYWFPEVLKIVYG